MKTCATCGQLRDTRPYGKGGTQVCFHCAFKTPEAKAETDRQLEARFVLAEAESNIVIIGGDDGPVPFKLPRRNEPS